jgi:glycerol-3-phosphate dehydrogenase
MDQVIRSFGAVRPNPFWVHPDPVSGVLVREDKGISSFILHETADSPGFLSLIGVKTPGLTCSDELGRHAAARMAEFLGITALNDSFVPDRRAPLRLNTLPDRERAALVARQPDYGRIVCRCRHVSEGEIVDSIHRAPGAVTVDGVKRRTGAGSGRCQGGFCTQRIVEILSRELGVPPEMILKDRPGSVIFGGQAHEDM